MKTHASRDLKVWRPQVIRDVELIYGTSAFYSTPRHFHEDMEISVNQKSGWLYSSRGNNYRVPASTALVTPPGEPHVSSTSGEGESVFLGLRIASSFIQQVTGEMIGHQRGMPHFVNPLFLDEQLSTSLTQLHAALRKDEASRLEQEGMVLDALAQLITRFSREHYAERPFAKEQTVVKRAQEYLQEHYVQQVSLEQLSAVTQRSVFHLSRIFGAEVGLPPHVYQMHLRIARAKVLLAQQHSIAQTALATGFASQSHFGMHFKRLVGVTPLQYIQDSKNTIDRGS